MFWREPTRPRVNCNRRNAAIWSQERVLAVHRRIAGNAGTICDVCPAMFAREYLSVVSRWARDQLRSDVQTPANRRHLRQLIEAAEALHAQLTGRDRNAATTWFAFETE